MTGERLAWFRVASHLGQSVEELAARITYREFLNWLEYLRWDESRDEKLHYYLAQIAAEVKKSVLKSSDANKIRIKDFVLSTEDSSKKPKKQEGSKSKWLGFLNIEEASKN